MLDQILQPQKPWHAAWLARESDILTTYACAAFLLISHCFFAINFVAALRRRRARKQAQQEGRDCAEELARIQHQQCRWEWFIVVLWLANVLAIASVDAYVGVRTLKAGVEEDPEAFDRKTILELVGYSLWITVLFVAAFITAPALQVIGIGRMLKWSAKKNGFTFNTVAPQVRIFSTSFAQLWALMCFGFSYFWSPVGESSVLRWVVIESLFGSALVWLDVSFALNFCSRSLDTLVLSRGGTGALQYFYRSMASVQQATSEAHETPAELPAVNEKTPLTAAQEMPTTV